MIIRRFIISACVIVAIASVSVHAAGTVTLFSDTAVRMGTGVQNPPGANWPNSRRIELRWTSDAMGNANGTIITPVAGTLYQVRVVPSGSAAPDDNYDVTLEDENGIDVLSGAGIDRDQANASLLVGPLMALDGTDTLELKIANAGASAQGTVVLLIVR